MITLGGLYVFIVKEYLYTDKNIQIVQRVDSEIYISLSL